MTYNSVDLFCGAGGFSAGFATEGFRTLGGVEINAIYNKTFTLNFPEAKCVPADIRQLQPEKFSEMVGVQRGNVDVLIGSPPCQTFSSIGLPKIKSIKTDLEVKTDPRNYLFYNYFEYVKYYAPPIFIMENVPGMKTRFEGRLFDRVTDQILDLGYEPHVEILNSVDYGVPQSRKRLFVVGTKKGIKFNFPEPTHRDAENHKAPNLFACTRDLPSPRTVFDAIADLPLVWDGCRKNELPYSRFDGLSEYQTLLRNKTGKVSNNICRMSNDKAKRVFEHMEQGCTYMDLPSKIRKILPFREDVFRDRLKRLDETKPSWTVIAHIGMDGYMYIHPWEHRTLSVREAARLQSFSDSFVFVGNMREQYIQVGNAVPPLMAKALGKEIKNSLG